MTAYLPLTLLIAAIVALTALAVYLDHRGLDVGNLFGTDPRDLVKRARDWDGGGE